MMVKRCVQAALLVLLAAAVARPATMAVSGKTLQIGLDEATRTVQVTDREVGRLLEGGVIVGQVAGRRVSSNARGLTASADEARGQIVFVQDGKPLARLRLTADDQFEVLTEAPLEGAAAWRCRAAMGDSPLPAILADDRKADGSVLLTTLGPASVSKARSLFDPQRDIALTATSPGQAAWRHGEGWELHATAPAGQMLATVRVHRRYYRDTLGLRYYAPIRKRPRWPTAPVVAMTWYGIEGWKGRPAQTREWLFPNVDWVAQHLLPYAGPNLVFQLDDNYAFNDDQYMRGISDYIRSKGLVPGIWFTPFTVAPASEHEKHPEWFVHDKADKPIPSFGGVNWPKHYTLNVSNPDAVKAWFAAWWRKTSETWNFDFFKIDGQPGVINVYRKATDGGGVEAYRKGLELARSIVGPEKFINGCWGIPLDAIGHLDGSRTGGDTGNQGHAIDVVLRWNFLNNVCWYSDPDAAANLFRATVERARLNAQARVLTGQQFLTDDVWVKVPPAIRRVWQLSFPMLDIRPVNLYRIDDWRRYDLFDLRIARPWGAWDVVGLFNYDAGPTTKRLDLARLPQRTQGVRGPGKVHVFEFWSSTYLGEFPHDAQIPRTLQPHEGQVFAVVPASPEHPVLVSTSRHVSQGGLDLAALEWTQDGETWMAKGRSTHLVAGDPYELVFAPGRFAGTKATSSQGKVSTAADGPLCRVRIEPERSGEAEWAVTFAPIRGPRVAVFPASLDVQPGAIATLQVRSLGTEGLRLSLRPSDERISVTPAAVSLGPWPTTGNVSVVTKAEGLKPGQTWEGQIVVVAEPAPKPAATVAVRLRMPPPENLARKAKATASSEWPGGYQPARAIDGDRSTRWNSREGDKDGCWLELRWEEPVEFNQVVIDECMDFGHRIQAWRLEAGDEKLEAIARGKTAGSKHAVTLPKPLTARRLRLTIEQADVVPTISELEVCRMP